MLISARLIDPNRYSKHKEWAGKEVREREPKLKDRDFGKSLISNLKNAKKEGDKMGEFNPMSVLEQDHLDEVGANLVSNTVQCFALH